MIDSRSVIDASCDRSDFGIPGCVGRAIDGFRQGRGEHSESVASLQDEFMVRFGVICSGRVVMPV